MPIVPRAEARPPLVLALDLGTSSFRAMVYDGEARAISGSETQLRYDIQTTRDGGAEVDAGVLVDLTAQAIDGALGSLGAAAGRIAAVGTAAFWHSLVGLDEHGEPVTPVLIWADSRSRRQVDALRRELNADNVHAETGTFIHSSYWPAKLLWVRAERPEWAARVRRWCSFTDYLFLRLCGDGRTSLSMASGTGLLAVHDRDWHAGMIAASGITRDMLPELTDRDRSLHALLPHWAARWPVLAGVPWFPAIGDGAAANVGSWAARPGRLALTIGTSGALRMVVRDRMVAPVPGLWSYRLDADRYVLGGALSNGGNVLAWLTDQLGVTFDGEAIDVAGRMPPDSHGLTVLPFLAGERSPSWNDYARGGVIGLTLATRSAELLRATMEGIAYRFALINAALRPLAGEQTPMVIANGGALLRSPAWLHIIADVLDEPVVALPANDEASAAGAAIVALIGLGEYPDPESAPDWAGPEQTTRYEPHADRHRVYAAAVRRQARLESALFGGDAQWDNPSGIAVSPTPH